jgi:transcription initiation factor TFIID subunit 6
MSNTSSILATQAIADSLGISITKGPLLSSFAQEGELMVQRVIGSAALLSANARAQRLTTQHINRVLLSEHSPPLVGYDYIQPISMVTIASDQPELSFPSETVLPLSEITDLSVVPLIQSFPFQYLLTEGVPADNKSLSNRRLLANPLKVDKSPAIAPLATNFPIELQQRSVISIARHVYETTQSAGEVLSPALQIYYVKILNSLRDDHVFSHDSAFQSLSTDTGLQQLLPYFLQYLVGQITLEFQDISQFKILLEMTASLVRNPALSSELYVHTFLKIVFSGLVGADMASPIHDDDTAVRDALQGIVDDVLTEATDPEVVASAKQLMG